jgi:3-dehydroquinate synthase
MRELTVALTERSYRILIGPGTMRGVDRVKDCLVAPHVMVVSNATVAPLFLAPLSASLTAIGVRVDEVVLPDGETHKNAVSLNQIYDALITAKCDRTSTIIALGGGVIGDLAGFAAATYQRGVPFIQIPTTLLAQVDSSVGGKTGINHPLGKNMVGAFWQPKLVLADTDSLGTLPDREFSAGMAEIIKYGIIRDAPFFDWLEANMDRLLARDQIALAHAIERSCANKAEVVAADERETAKDGGRALLNLGHTFGHAIETGIGYGTWLHGEAVAAGMVMAAELSRRLGWLTASEIDRIQALVTRAKLPVRGPKLGAARYLELMSHDKKVIGGRMRLVLIKALGEAVTWADATPSDIVAAIDTCCDD